MAVIKEPLESLDHDGFGSNRSKTMNMIDSNILERDASGKPHRTFSSRSRFCGASTAMLGRGKGRES
jgi:hypothetical protein